MPSLPLLLVNIRKGISVDTELLKPYLMAELVSERYLVNHDLALAYTEGGDIALAQVFAERAWLFSPNYGETLPMYEKVMLQAGNLHALREAYRRVGDEKGTQEGFAEALPFFLKSMYVFANNGGGDRYIFDRDMLNSIQNLAKEKEFLPVSRKWSKGVRKLRVAYLVFGTLHVNSVIVRILKRIAEHHDRARFEFAFFVPENEFVDRGCFDQIRSTINALQAGGDLVVVSNGSASGNVLEDCARQIYDYSPDILVTSALLADLKQYYIASLRPAPVIIGMTHGPPPQFSDRILDWSISWDPHAHADCMSSSTRIPLEVDLPVASNRRRPRSDWNLHDDHTVIIAAGRVVKFLDRKWWDAVAVVLRNHPQAILVVVGITEKPAFLVDMLKDTLIGKRIRIFGWLRDYQDLLSVSDVMIDAHPSGSGVALMDGMSYGLPTVTFKNDFMRLFDQTDWSPGEWVVDIPELTAAHGDFDGFSTILERLIQDEGYRGKMGEWCRESVHARLGSPERMVKRIEDVYEEVAGRLLKQPKDTFGPLPDVEPFRASMIERNEFWQLQEAYIIDEKNQLMRELPKNPQILKMLTSTVRFARKITGRK